MKVLTAINVVMTTLFKFKAPCQYIKAVKTLTNFEVHVDPIRYGTKVSKVLMTVNDLSVATGREVRVAPRGNHVVIQIPLKDRKFPKFSDLYSNLGNHKPWNAALGYDDLGEIMLFDLSNPSIAHIGVFGTTGSGKSSALNVLVASLCLRHAREELLLYIFDPKWVGDTDFARIVSKNLICLPDTDPIEAGYRLAAITKQMEKRRENQLVPRVIIMTDETADLCSVSDEAKDALTRIAGRGRGVGFHLILGTQKPTAEALSSLMTANIPTRVVGKVVNKRESNVATGLSDRGADRLLTMGDFIVIKSGRESRVQGAYPDFDCVPIPAVVNATPAHKTDESVGPADKPTAVAVVGQAPPAKLDNSLIMWDSDRLVIGGSLRGAAGYKDYSDYCAEHGVPPVSLVNWGKYMRSKYDKQQDKLGVFYNMVSLR